MRSLVITSYAPLPPERSSSAVYKRFRMFINALALISDRIEFLCLVSERDVDAYPDPITLDAAQSEYWGHPVHMTLVPIGRRHETMWKHYGAGMFSISGQPYYYQFAGPEQVEAIGRHLATRPDLVFVFRLAAMTAVLRSDIRPERMFFDLDDVEHIVRVRTALEPPFWPGKAIYCAHAPAILAAERQAAKRSQALFVCSEHDARHLRRFGFGPNVTVVPNAISLPEATGDTVAASTVMFIGGYNYKPNRDAAERLLTKIWPIIRADMPNALLIVAGQGPEQIPAFADSPIGVEFTGFVPDLAALYSRCRVVVCPLMMGGGTRVKLIEAASYAKPAVSTRIGAEGLALIDGVEIMLHDDDQSFAAACIALLRDDSLCQRIGAAARAKVVAHHDVKQVERQIADIMCHKDGG
jgi:glycosyltransferase involved in cell wall biosynthesis